MKDIQKHAASILDLTTITPDDLVIKPIQERKTVRTRGGKAFSKTDVEAIFSGYIYRGALPANRTKAYPFWFWLPLVGYFTGARTNEIAQLEIFERLTATLASTFVPMLQGPLKRSELKQRKRGRFPFIHNLLN
ncbi:hypothetical protein [Pseudomonas aeruginosa]|nr:hypothetical protein [Pseudomonas aeruginosa]